MERFKIDLNCWISNHTTFYIWYNSRINTNFKKDWLKKGYVKVADILNTDGDIFSFNEIWERGLGINFLEYETLIFDISWLNVREGYLPYIFLMTGYNQKGCSKTYNLLMEYNQNIITDIKNKWDISLSDDIPKEKIMKSRIIWIYVTDNILMVTWDLRKFKIL